MTNPATTTELLEAAECALHTAFSHLTEALVEKYPDCEGEAWVCACEWDPIGHQRDAVASVMLELRAARGKPVMTATLPEELLKLMKEANQ